MDLCKKNDSKKSNFCIDNLLGQRDSGADDAVTQKSPDGDANEDTEGGAEGKRVTDAPVFLFSC